MFDMVRKLDKLGYDRYRIDGNCMTATCRLWKARESESSLRHTASGPYFAMLGALAWAEFLAESSSEVLQVGEYGS